MACLLNAQLALLASDREKQEKLWTGYFEWRSLTLVRIIH